MHVLVVEDKTYLAKPLADQLAERGHTCTVAIDRSEALAALKNCAAAGKAYGLAILDWDYGAGGTALDVLPHLQAYTRTVVYSGLDRTRDLLDADQRVDYVVVKDLAGMREIMRIVAEVASGS
jgi:DNA-binding response OmpR family regulator